MEMSYNDTGSNVFEVVFVSGGKMNKTIRVLLADDHEVVRKGIREFLEENGDLIERVEMRCDA